jgi:hypothetical protein
MGRLEIVAPGGAHALATDAKSLWIAPDLWKTHRTRFPQILGRAQNARPHAPQAFHFMLKEKNRNSLGVVASVSTRRYD